MQEYKKKWPLTAVLSELSQPRVISVHSYYLTSLVNLSFLKSCSLVVRNPLRITFSSWWSLQRDALLCGNISLCEGCFIRLCRISTVLICPAYSARMITYLRSFMSGWWLYRLLSFGCFARPNYSRLRSVEWELLSHRYMLCNSMLDFAVESSREVITSCDYKIAYFRLIINM